MHIKNGKASQFKWLHVKNLSLRMVRTHLCHILYGGGRGGLLNNLCNLKMFLIGFFWLRGRVMRSS